MASPYHLLGDAASEDSHMRFLEARLLHHNNAGEQPEQLMFRTVADALDRAPELASERQRNLVVGLVDRALSHPVDPTLHVFALLRVLMPQTDNRSVYGFKTQGLLKSFAKAMEKTGGISGKGAAAQLLLWGREPKPNKTRQQHLVTYPEAAIAMAHGRCFSAPEGAGLSVVEVAGLCQRLTHTYKERHKQAVITLVPTDDRRPAMSVHIDSVAEILAGVLPRLSYTECKVLVKLLLRTVPMGVGTRTCTEALGPYLGSFLGPQQDLGRLAMAVVTHPTLIPGMRCGTPVTPMTCHPTSSPYIMKYLFTKPDTIGKRYLTPKSGRLIIHSTGIWLVPLVGSNSAMRNRYVDLESAVAVSSRTRRDHMLVLRDFRRNSGVLLRKEAAQGYLLSYMLYYADESGQNNGGEGYVLLLQGARLLSTCPIDLVDATVGLDDPPPNPLPAAKRTKREALAQLLKSMVPPVMPPSSLLRVMWVGQEEEEAESEEEEVEQGSPKTRGSRKKPASSKTKKKAAPPPFMAKGVMVQRKMDGDRMQAHIMKDPQGKPLVRLFTKRGRPVHTLYSDVARELEEAVQDQPCILDGEIIVVDKDGEPMPWSSAKWRYDSGNGKTLSALMGAASDAQTRKKGGVVTLVGDAGAYGYNPDDGEDALTFAPSAAALAHWDDLGASEKERLKTKEVQAGEGGFLQFVVFDVLMLRGKSMISVACAERFRQLSSMQSLKRLKHTRVLSEAWSAQTADDLVKHLQYIVQKKGEGLILKDPRSRYEFARSLHQRKLKISGPDINCGVVGMGFTQSRNPRMWGLLTCIRSSDGEKLLVYNRVETLEGDQISTAAEHVLGLNSRVSLQEVLRSSSSEKPLVLPGGAFSVYATILVPPRLAFSVTWRGSDQHCTVYFLQGAPKDIQWLCNPLECNFGLSQRGDAYPVEWRGADDTGLLVLVPRFPVGRIQLEGHQRSELDTPTTIEAKFTEAAEATTCIQGFFQRKIRQLRTRPPDPKKLEELRRILTGMQDTREPWPQLVPTMFMLNELSALLVKHGFEELTAGERMVLAGIPKASQWDPLILKQHAPLASYDADDLQAQFAAEALAHAHRMQLLKTQLRRPVLLPPRTGVNILASLLQPTPLQPMVDECFADALSSSPSSLCGSLSDDEQVEGDPYGYGGPPRDDAEAHFNEAPSYYQTSMDEEGYYYDHQPAEYACKGLPY